MAGIPQQQSALLDAECRVAVDAPCLQCGYNLRSLEATGYCPECRALVITSLQQGLLRFAPREWTNRIARGLLLLIISLGIMLAGTFLMVVFGIALAMAMRTSGPMGGVIFGMVAFYTALLASAITGIVGLVFSTTRDPVAIGKPMEHDARWLVRRCLWMLLILFVIYIGLSINLAVSGGFQEMQTKGPMSVFGLGTDNPANILFGLSAALQMFVGGILLPAAFLRHLGNLSRLTPKRGLVTFAKIEFWLFLISSITMMVGYTGVFIHTAKTFVAAPITTSATAPSVPGSILTQMTYNNATATWTMTQTTSMPSGAPIVRTTTMPTMGWSGFGKPTSTAPVAFVTNPTRPSPGLIIAGAIAGAAGCMTFPVSVAAIILMFMVYGAIRNESKIAS